MPTLTVQISEMLGMPVYTVAGQIEHLLEINRRHMKDGRFGVKRGGGGPIAQTQAQGGADPRVAVPSLQKVQSPSPFDGKPVPQSIKVSKQDGGKIGENVIIGYLQQFEGMKDARHANTQRNNFAVDIAYDHRLVEGKAGNAGNDRKSQQWRLTIGEPGKKEKEALKAMTPAQKKAHNDRKEGAILERKAKAQAEAEKVLGHKVTPRTISVILDHEHRTAHIYSFEGFHPRVGWTSDQAKKGFVGAFRY